MLSAVIWEFVKLGGEPWKNVIENLSDSEMDLMEESEKSLLDDLEKLGESY